MWLDASTSYARPPAGIQADPSQYGLFGGRFSSMFAWGGLSVAGRYGEAFAGSEGRWLRGDASLVTGGRLGRLAARLVASGFGLRYLDPFSYDAGGIEVRPGFSYPVGRFIFSALPRFSAGRWASNGLDGELRVAGGEVEAQRSFGTVTAMLSGGLLQVRNGVTEGRFSHAAGDLVMDRGRWTASARFQVQKSPLETELGGGVQLTVTLLPGLEVQAYGGKRVRDPLFGTAGSVALSLSTSIRAVGWSPPGRPPVAAIGEPQDGGRVVTFGIRAPGAETVAVTGDFTGWEPVAMEPAGDGWWRLERVVPPGLHHFGFLVDGQWAIPPQAPGVVEDGWGRENASIVVEP